MCANISINAIGITQPLVNGLPPNGGASLKRNNKSLVVTISANPLARALSALSQHHSRLRRANIVRIQREAQAIYYLIEDTDVLHILRLLSYIYDHDPVMRPRRH